MKLGKSVQPVEEVPTISKMEVLAYYKKNIDYFQNVNHLEDGKLESVKIKEYINSLKGSKLNAEPIKMFLAIAETLDSMPAPIKALAISSLVYLISPIDLIPDVTPILGLVDDVIILTTIWAKISSFVEEILSDRKISVNSFIDESLDIEANVFETQNQIAEEDGKEMAVDEQKAEKVAKYSSPYSSSVF